MRRIISLFFCSILALPVFVRAGVTFFVACDSHYGSQQWEDNEEMNKAAIYDMNALPSTPYPDDLGGVVATPRGVMVAGDLTHDGEVWEWYGWWLFWKWSRDGFIDDYGLTGDGLLNYPVYEGYGNHDTRNEQNKWVMESVKRRNAERDVLVYTSSNGYHYSWDWEGVHFVQLNVYPGSSDEANGSLAFLKEDLRERAGDTGRPIVIVHHYGMDEFSIDDHWWTQDERDAYRDVIAPYNVIAIFAGHSHDTEVMTWEGIDVFSAGTVQDNEYLVCRLENGTLSVAQRRQGEWTDFIFQKKVY